MQELSVTINELPWCRLEAWQQDKQYDRLGLDEETTRIIDTDVPLVTIPASSGTKLGCNY